MSSTAYVPFSEPSYITGLPSPYYQETHLRWQKACRAFVDKHLIEKSLEWDTEETVPPHVWETFAKANMLIPTLPAPLPVEWLKKLGVHNILGVVKVEEWDYIHTMIYADEVSRLSSPRLRGLQLTWHIADGAHRTGRPQRQSHNRHGLWRAADPQVWKQAATRALPPRPPHRPQANLHSYNRA